MTCLRMLYQGFLHLQIGVACTDPDQVTVYHQLQNVSFYLRMEYFSYFCLLLIQDFVSQFCYTHQDQDHYNHSKVELVLEIEKFDSNT